MAQHTFCLLILSVSKRVQIKTETKESLKIQKEKCISKKSRAVNWFFKIIKVRKSYFRIPAILDGKDIVGFEFSKKHRFYRSSVDLFLKKSK